jgi:hypothetical protein
MSGKRSNRRGRKVLSVFVSEQSNDNIQKKKKDEQKAEHGELKGEAERAHRNTSVVFSV